MSSPRGRRQASLPPAGFKRPSPIDDSGLVFTLFGENGGIEGVFSFTHLPCAVAVRRAIVRGFAAVCGPGGDWRSVKSGENAHRAIRSLLEYLAAQPDPPQTVEQLTPALLAAWNEQLGPALAQRKHVGQARRVLLGTPGVPAGVGRALRLGANGAKEDDEPASYSLEEFQVIRSTAASIFNSALIRIRANRSHLRRWYAGEFDVGTEAWSRGEALDLVLRTGNVTVYTHATKQLRAAQLRALGPAAPAAATRNELFLDTVELFALHVLLVASEAWNRSVLATMTVPEHNPGAADDVDVHMVEIDKRRRPVRLRHTSNNLVDDGPDSPGRLMAQAVEATELARQTMALLGKPTSLLLVARAGVGQARTSRAGFVFGVTRHGTKVFADRVGLVGADGKRRSVTLQPLRRTVQVRILKEPKHNSQDVHDDVYVLRDASTPQAAGDTIAQGLNDALQHARTVTTMRMVLGDDADLLLELADHPELAQAVITGAADTATAACTGYTDSPHAEPGRACPASFLLCLGCRNAIGTPRHLPRLVYLRSCLDSLRATVAEAVWDLDWREHWLRLESLLKLHTTAVQQDDALRRLSDRDRALIDNLLRRRLDP